MFLSQLAEHLAAWATDVTRVTDNRIITANRQATNGYKQLLSLFCCVFLLLVQLKPTKSIVRIFPFLACSNFFLGIKQIVRLQQRLN